MLISTRPPLIPVTNQLIPVIPSPAGWCSTSCLCSASHARPEWSSRYSATRPRPLPPPRPQTRVPPPLSTASIASIATSRRRRSLPLRRALSLQRARSRIERRVRISSSTGASATLLPLPLPHRHSSRQCARKCTLCTAARCTCTRRTRRCSCVRRCRRSRRCCTRRARSARPLAAADLRTLSHRHQHQQRAAPMRAT